MIVLLEQHYKLLGMGMANVITKKRIRELLAEKRDALVLQRDAEVDGTEMRAALDGAIGYVTDLLADVEWLFKYPRNEEQWEHVSNLDSAAIFDTFGKYEIVTEDDVYNFLCERIKSYFELHCIQDDELDFFYIDYALAVSYRYQAKKMGDADFAKAFPKLSAAIEKWDGERVSALVYYIVLKLVKYVAMILLLLVLVAYASEGSTFAGLLAAGLVGYKIYSWVSQVRKFTKLKEQTSGKLQKLKKTYELLADGVVRWKVLADDAKLLREIDVDLPLAIHTAIERNVALSK